MKNALIITTALIALSLGACSPKVPAEITGTETSAVDSQMQTGIYNEEGVQIGSTQEVDLGLPDLVQDETAKTSESPNR